MTMRPSLRPFAPALIAIAIILASLGFAACVSDRATANTTVSTAICTAPATTAGATIIFIRDFTFLPPNVRVKAGGTVAWVNCEPTSIPHTSTADGGGWNSASLAPAAAFVRGFPSAGSFPYHCAIHPSMKATVIVE